MQHSFSRWSQHRSRLRSPGVPASAAPYLAPAVCLLAHLSLHLACLLLTDPPLPPPVHACSPPAGIQAALTSAPEALRVVCNSNPGLYLVTRRAVECHCDTCSYIRKDPRCPEWLVSPTEYERHSGMPTAKKWRYRCAAAGRFACVPPRVFACWHSWGLTPVQQGPAEGEGARHTKPCMLNAMQRWKCPMFTQNDTWPAR